MSMPGESPVKVLCLCDIYVLFSLCFPHISLLFCLVINIYFTE